MNAKVLTSVKNRRSQARKSTNNINIAVRFDRFYNFMSNLIGGGNSYAPNETKW